MTLSALALVAGGLIALALGGEALVRGAVAVAEHLGVSQLLIGLAVVGFGTSAPELLTSVLAVLDGSPGIAIGNVVGSNTANVLLIVGAAALIRPIVAAPRGFIRDSVVMMAATLLGAAAMWTGEIGRVMGVAFVVVLAAYVVLIYSYERREKTSPGPHAPEASGPHERRRLGLALGALVGGLALTLLGAHWLVGGALELSRGLGVEDTVVGLTIVALGTSLPEVVTCVMAARRGHSDIALGNVVGSNLYNILGILGVTATVMPIEVPAHVIGFDLWVMLGASALLVAAAVTGWRVSRWEGGLLLSLYAAYGAFLALAAPEAAPH